ncbi:MAG: GNAT family N-acetyltransferase [Gemmatimonadota bacterium]
MRFFRPDEELWWEVAGACDYATFYHTPLWHRLAAGSLWGRRDATVAAELPGGVRVIFPLLRRRRGLRPGAVEFASTFAGCYGGPIADGPITVEDRARLYRAVASRSRDRVAVTGNPLDPAEPPESVGRRREDATHLLELDAPFDSLFAEFSKGHRSSTSKGRREGVVARMATTLDDYRRYYTVYQAALRRWGDRASSRYPWRFFRNGQRLAARHPDRIKLWLAALADEVVAGAWIFYWGGHATYWHGASNDRAREVNAANVLLADAIRDATERDLRFFDFNPSGGHEGVAAFKRRFGASAVRICRWTAEEDG